MWRSEFFLCVLFLCTECVWVLSPPIHSIIIASFGFEQLEQFCTCGMSYRWFQGFDWDGLRQRTLVCPIVQQVSTNLHVLHILEAPHSIWSLGNFHPSGFITAVAVFWKPNTIPLCFSIYLFLSFLMSWLLVLLPSTFFLDVLFFFSPVVPIP